MSIFPLFPLPFPFPPPPPPLPRNGTVCIFKNKFDLLESLVSILYIIQLSIKYHPSIISDLKGVDHGVKLKFKQLRHNLAGGLEGQLHNVLVLVARRDMKDGEDVGPARLNVVCLAVHNVGNTAHHHVSHRAALVVLHDMLEGTEEVLLEVKVSELALLDELGGELTQRVHGKE
jgi:hypothetical protein